MEAASCWWTPHSKKRIQMSIEDAQHKLMQVEL